jgi:EmrB/QacA subfamily drug resistance transporter
MKSDVPGSTSELIVLLVSTMAAFLFSFMGSAVNIALPSIAAELSLDAVTLGWISTAYLLASATSLVPLGRLADIHGRKRIFVYGVLIYTISALLCGSAGSAAMLISFRVLQGIGGAMTVSTSVAIISSVFPANERGKALGIQSAAVYIGVSLGPVVGGILTQQFGWRSIFYVNVPVGLIIVGMALWKLKGEWAEARGERFDIIGSAIYVVALVAGVYGFTLLPAMPGVWLIVVGVAALSAFARWGMRAKNPILDIKIFRNNRTFTFSNLAAFANYSATFAVTFLLSLYLQYVKGFEPQSAGLILLSMPAVQAIVSPLAGRLSDRIEPRVIASIGMGLTTAGLILFILLDGETSLGFITGALVLMGAGLGLFVSPNTNAIMSSASRRDYGVASATVATMRQVGMVFSMGVAMLMFSLYIGRVEITPEQYLLFLQSMKISFIVFAILCFGGIFASLARGKIR